MILGAGRGTRLATMGLTVPKVLVDVGQRPLLERQIDYLSTHGVERVVVNAHHLAEAVEAFARQYTGPVDLTVVTEPRLLGTAGGVRNALPALGDEPFFVLYGDVLVDQPLTEIAETHGSRGAAATVTVYQTNDIEGKGTVVTDEDGWVLAFAEKDPDAPTPALVNAGLYVLDPGFVARLPHGRELDFGRDVFPTALDEGARIFAYLLDKAVIDVGTPEGLAAGEARVQERGDHRSSPADP
jgi:NDP-sugar pyrophosphorylase family protein